MPNKKTNPNEIVVLTTSVGEELVIRSGPTDVEVRNFVREHTRRQLAGEVSGYDLRGEAHQAHRIFTAKRYSSEVFFLGAEGGSEPEEIDISDILPTP